MTEQQDTVRQTLAALGLALTGKPQAVTDPALDALIDGREFYLADGGYSRIIVSELTGKARLTSNSRAEAMHAWVHCPALIADLERQIWQVRTSLGWPAPDLGRGGSSDTRLASKES